MKQHATTIGMLLAMCALTGCRAPVAAELTPPPPLKIQVFADSQDMTLDSQEFTAEGNAKILYGDVVLTADRVQGSAKTGNVQAVGCVSFRNATRWLMGDTFTYNFRSGSGVALNARAESDGMFFHGAEMVADPARYELRESRFTTCNLENPHYYLRARELILEPEKRLMAKGVKFVVLGKTIFTLPRYTANLTPKEKRRGFRLPSLGISERSGPYAGYQFSLQHGANTTGLLDVRLSTKLIFQGGLTYDEIAGQPVFLRAVYREPAFSGTKGNLIVSRLPEVGLRIGPRDAEGYSTSREPLSLSRDLLNPLEAEASADRRKLLSEIGWGHFDQDPGGASTTRLDARLLGLFNAYHITDRTLVSPGVFGRVSTYGTGDTYTDLAFRIGLAQKLSDDSYVSCSYVKHTTQGETPFDFDAVDPHEELAAEVGFPSGKYGVVLKARYNLARSEMYNVTLSVSRVLHCIQPSITWRNRFRELTFDLELVQL